MFGSKRASTMFYIVALVSAAAWSWLYFALSGTG